MPLFINAHYDGADQREHDPDPREGQNRLRPYLKTAPPPCDIWGLR